MDTMQDTLSPDYTPPELKDVVAHAREYGFIYPSSDIYAGLQAVYDYGPYGVALKRNVQTLWWQSMTQLNTCIVGLDAAIFMHPTTWKASGHVDHFSDLMIDHKDSHKRYRVDRLIENHAAQLAEQGAYAKAQELLQTMHHLLKTQDLAGLYTLIVAENIPCPSARTVNWTPVRPFNLLFTTQAGAVENETHTLYLRPETAQGIFVNFLNVQKTARMKIPFGIAQIGKAFRNELVARQFIFRMREFEQMEMQFFIQPGREATWFAYWRDMRFQWYRALGIPQHQLTIQPHEQLAHYAKEAVDIMYHFPFGCKEVEGIHSRTDFDLQNHQKHAKKTLAYFDSALHTKYLPYVIETSAGCDRIIFMLLSQALVQETTQHATPRTYLKLPPALAPIKAAIFPLVKKEGLPERAQAIFNTLKYDFALVYEETTSIGKRYARQDLIGTPYCITVDYQTLADGTVTIRERDSMQQERLPSEELANYLAKRVSLHTILAQLPSI